MVPLFLLGWEADFPDPSNFLIVLLHSRSRGTNNNAFYANPEVDRLLDEAEPLLEPGRRFTIHAICIPAPSENSPADGCSAASCRHDSRSARTPVAEHGRRDNYIRSPAATRRRA